MTPFTPALPFLIEGLDWTLRASCLLGAATLFAFLVRRRSAALRHLVWSAAMAGAIILPVLKWSIPGWSVPTWFPVLPADTRILVKTPLPNSPALLAGLKPGDMILSVNGTEVTELTETVKRLRGPQGSDVKLRIRRGADEMDLVVTRDVVYLGVVRGLALDKSGKWRYWLAASSGIGYVRITEFSRRTRVELETVLTGLRESGLKGLALDLRGCPGGLLEESVSVASLFLKTGAVASIQARQKRTTLSVDGTAQHGELPLVVLIDEVTASAAEVLAAALQDHGRAILVGERTFGKGSVQTLIPLNELSASLKLTTSQIHRPNGMALERSGKSQSWGVDPNDGYYIPFGLDQRAAWQARQADRDTAGAVTLPELLSPAQILDGLADPALAAAFQTLSDKVTSGEFRPSGRPLAEMQPALAEREQRRGEKP